MEKVGVTVIGAGIIGLAVAAEISKRCGSIFIVEKNESFGMETSSRNSEVIHAGIYYPKGSLKHRLCIEGNQLLYEICERNGISYKRTGKFIVAAEKDEIEDLYVLYENGKENDVPGLKMVSAAEAGECEPSVKSVEAIFSPTTGIFDSHGLMKYFLTTAKTAGAEIVFNTEITGISKATGGYIVKVKENDGGEFEFLSEIVVNCAGLQSDVIAAMAGIDINSEGYGLKYCKGSYFRVENPSRFGITHLVYPVVKKNSTSLGIHVALDLSGRLRLGPDAEYMTERINDYNVPLDKRKDFYNSVKNFIPMITMDSLYPDTSGIRPKLQGLGESFRDFIIKEEKDKGLPGLVNLVGIDSPGLTASPAIARNVKDLIYE